MFKKRQEIPIPYLGFDHYENYDSLVNTKGSTIIGIKVKNLAIALSSEETKYKSYHSALDNIIKTIGPGYQMQKLDILSKDNFRAEDSKNYLQKKYSEHFENRQYKVIETILVFSHYNEDDKAIVNLSDKEEKELHQRVNKVKLLLDDYGFEPQYMVENDYYLYTSSLITGDFKSNSIGYNNLYSTNTRINFGDKTGCIIDFIDTQEMNVPPEISPYKKIGGNSVFKDTIIDNLSFINDLNNYEFIIYNQIVSIPNQNKRKKKLEAKKRRHISMKSDAENKNSAQDIDDMFDDISKNSSIIVDAHFSLLVVCSNEEDLKLTTSKIETCLFELSIYVSKTSYNQFELFETYLLGNLDGLKSYNYFTTTSESACCFFFKEKYQISEESNFYLRFCDRQGVPVRVDLADLPMKTNRINNRNKFVLGPSGSGKSFLMNNIIEQYIPLNYDVVIVDVGDSYSGIAEFFGAKYIKYEEEKPITMNPFNIGKEEFNIEKTEFIVNLILTLWRGEMAEPTTTEKAVIGNLIDAFYKQYFNQGTDWYKDFDNDYLIGYLKNFNCKTSDIINGNHYSDKDYYSTLEVGFSATQEEIKASYKRLSKIYHPDVNLTGEGTRKFIEISTANEVLTDKEKKRKYDMIYISEIQEFNINKYQSNADYYTSEEFRIAIIEKIKEIEVNYYIKELKFDTFYEFSKIFLEKFLSQKEFNLTSKHFDFGNFLFILKDFYKGGKFDTMLNESTDISLFEANFIVFEIDNIKNNKKLFPLVTLIIMDIFIQKMRLRSNRRKVLAMEEAWKAVANERMAENLVYLYKTARKFWAEVIVVTQEIGDILGNPIVKDSIINNSDTYILLDQSKFADNFDELASLLSLNQSEKSKILTINQLDNKHNRSYFKECYIKRGSTGEVYGLEVSIYQYFSYTTEKPEKMAVETYKKLYDTYEETLDVFVEDFKKLGTSPTIFCDYVNFIGGKIGDKEIEEYKIIRKRGIKDVVKYLKEKKEQKLEETI